MVFMPHWPPKYPKSNQILDILTLLGAPHKHLPPIIHVTGTNGKGSIIAFLKHILQAHQLTTHIFTSPHLLSFNENFTIANKPISDQYLFALTEEIRIKLADKIKPSLFEFQTALAFLAFSRQKADFCIIECGMGAKNDPTNILNNKLLAIISSISLDHQEYLGEDITEIAYDKAHIINCPTISSPQAKLVQVLLDNYAQKIAKQELIAYQKDYDFDLVNDKLIYIDIKREIISEYNLPSLVGDHQVINLITAITALKNQNIIQLNDKLINQGINNTTWPARLEKIDQRELKHIKNLPEIWFDGAHNPAGAYALSQWLKQKNKQKNLIIYGSSVNRKHDKFLKHLNHQNNDLIFIEVKNETNQETIFNFNKFLKQHSQYHINICKDLEEALFIAEKKQIYNNIIICGSLYLYRDLKKL
jgi:dihydrofolate synthase/folylpolyglutamate synthase